MRAPGSGALSAYGYLDGTASGGVAGLGLDLEARLKRDLALVATGRVGERWGDRGSGLAYEAIASLRYNW